MRHESSRLAYSDISASSLVTAMLDRFGTGRKVNELGLFFRSNEDLELAVRHEAAKAFGIPNLIAFYYGRNPRTMQADTVLQHSRMYGNRDRRDLAVTRFYTSRDVYDRLYTINDFENPCWRSGDQDARQLAALRRYRPTQGRRSPSENFREIQNVQERAEHIRRVRLEGSV